MILDYAMHFLPRVRLPEVPAYNSSECELSTVANVVDCAQCDHITGANAAQCTILYPISEAFATDAYAAYCARMLSSHSLAFSFASASVTGSAACADDSADKS